MSFWLRNAPLMSLQYIQRWALIHMNREQSVADHSFRTWVLARDLYTVLSPVAHNTYEERSVELWALIHDADEFWISDIPGHVKAAINKDSPGIFDRYSEKKFAQVMPWFSDIKRGVENTVVIPIVKIADLIESHLYCDDHSTVAEEKFNVFKYVQGRAAQVIAEASKKYATYRWDQVEQWIHDVTCGEPSSITALRLVGSQAPAEPTLSEQPQECQLPLEPTTT